MVHRLLRTTDDPGRSPGLARQKSVVHRLPTDLEGAVNVGSEEAVTVNELVATVMEVAGKDLTVEHVEGPVGVHSRNFSKVRIHSTGWRATTSLTEGIAETYRWVKGRVEELEE
jgi:nucleoside-diphosphate-sugar epimerase